MGKTVEENDLEMLGGMGASNDAMSETARRKKKKAADEAILKELFDKPKRIFIPD